jgi:CDP-diacylglycerol--glycerol-3-phosphate 3-phosphatidyltransferase
MRREFLTPSNILSLTRAVLVVPFVLIVLSSLPSARIWGALIMVLAALTDRYDGILARKYGQETELGRILDPLADKLAVGAAALVLLVLGDIPLWYVLALLARDLLIFAGGMVIKARSGVVLPSHPVGKVAVGIIALALFVVVLGGPSLLATILIWVSVVFLLLSFGIYAARFVEEMKKSPA